ncbi:hypothetical protein [Candidatus Accumulibacter contiguus]|jgi:hypothetical protein|uniref:hypothetical protein n=1 Tax=Candidatus Accumulibacter contiguus TaxID=2954381 RepID=UPI0038CBF59B
MPGITEQCQRSRPEAGHCLDPGKAERQQQGPEQAWTGVHMMMRMLAMLVVIVLMVLVRVLEVWIAHDPGIVPEIAVPSEMTPGHASCSAGRLGVHRLSPGLMFIR